MLNHENYISEANGQLSDTNYYKEVWEDLTSAFTLVAEYIIKSFPHQLQGKRLPLIPNSSTPGTFYMLPKIHKESNPGKLIIFNCGCLTGLL